MKSDIEIARSVKIQNIFDVASKAGFKDNEIIPFGDYSFKQS